jgi:hypothetical protein
MSDQPMRTRKPLSKPRVNVNRAQAAERGAHARVL